MRLEIQRKNQLAKSMLGPTRWLHILSNCFADRSRCPHGTYDVLTMDVGVGGTFCLSGRFDR